MGERGTECDISYLSLESRLDQRQQNLHQVAWECLRLRRAHGNVEPGPVVPYGTSAGVFGLC